MQSIKQIYYRLKMRWYNFTHQAEALNRRVGIECTLLSIASGKKPLPSKEECRVLALKLGTPKKYWREEWK